MSREPLSEREVYLAAVAGAVLLCLWVVSIAYGIAYLWRVIQ